MLEAIAYDQALNLRAMRQLYPAINPDRVKVSGGGARSALWNQIKADVIGLTHERMHPDHMAAVGTALIAGRVWASSRISLRPRGGGPTS